MNEHINKQIDAQIIEEDGKPKFAVIPIKQFRKLLRRADMEPTVPNAVVQRIFEDKVSPIKAWREHLGLSQQEVAARLGVSQSAYAQKERVDANLRPKSKTKIASALGLMVEQIEV
jgi:DNA-binding XRE family transcriptional regulator